MKRVIINIDWVPNNFAASPQNEDVACVATGKTLEEVETNIVDALAFHLEGMLENGETIPSEFKGEWKPIFKLTTRAQLKYTDNYISRKALSRETGIAEQQLSHYATGLKKPRAATQKKILDGIQAISRQLAVIL